MMDGLHNHPVAFERQELMLKNSDLGPMYKPPIKAWAYIMVLGELSKNPPYGVPSE